MPPGEPKIPLLKQVVCPTCWNEFPPEEMHWIAVHDDLVDERFSEHRQLRFLPSRFSIGGMAYDEKGRECTEMACPRCGNVIIPHLLQMRPLFLSILGAPGSGKSFFLAAAVRELQRTLGARLNIRFQNSNPLGNHLITSYIRELFDHADDPETTVKLKKTELDGDDWYYRTIIGGQDILLPKPYLYAIQPSRDHAMYDNQDGISRVLSLYDNAGEHFLPGSITGTAPVIDHLARSEALLFVYDPLQESAFRERCKKHTQTPDPQVEYAPFKYPQADVLAEAAAHVKRLKKIPPTKLYDKPLIVIVQKFDAWQPLVGKALDRLDKVWKVDADGQPLLDSDLIRTVSQTVEQLLLDIAPSIVNEAQAFCSEVVFIPVTATGRSPMAKGTDEAGRPDLLFRPGTLKPRWCELPVLYALLRAAKDRDGAALLQKVRRASSQTSEDCEDVVPFRPAQERRRG